MTRATKAILVVSLVFNIMFAIGYVASSLSATPSDTAESAADLVSRKLGLDDEQRRAFLKLRKETQKRKRELRQAMGLARERLTAEQCKADRDDETIRRLKADVDALRQSYREISFHQSDRFLTMLTPKQRKQLHDFLRKQGKPADYDEEFLKQFDEDGDGKLSRAERDKAIRATRERSRKPGKGRPRGSKQKGPKNAKEKEPDWTSDVTSPQTSVSGTQKEIEP